MGLMMEEFNSQLSGTQSHCWGIRLALTRPPRGLGQRVLKDKAWDVSSQVAFLLLEGWQCYQDPKRLLRAGQSEVVTHC